MRTKLKRCHGGALGEGWAKGQRVLGVFLSVHHACSKVCPTLNPRSRRPPLSPSLPLSLALSLSLFSVSLLSLSLCIYASLTHAPLSGLRNSYRSRETLPDPNVPAKSSKEQNKDNMPTNMGNTPTNNNDASVPPRERESSVTSSSEFLETPSGTPARVELGSCIVGEEEDLICTSAQDAFPCEEERLDMVAGDVLPAAALENANVKLTAYMTQEKNFSWLF